MESAAGPACIGEPFHYPEKNPEKLFATMVAGAADDEVAARLVYAESLASRCLELHPEADGLAENLADSIAAVVWNRIRAKDSAYGEGVRGVVFKGAQFRSTFGGCDVSTRREFLCPLASEAAGVARSGLWDVAVRAVEKAKAGGENPLPGVHHYFFPRHFDESKSCAKWKGVFPAWAKERTRIEPSFDHSRSVKVLSSCVSFYR
jgi:hypothetical protein